MAAEWAGCTKPKLVPANQDPFSRYNSEGAPIFRGALFILLSQIAMLTRRRTFCEIGLFFMAAKAVWFTHVNAVHNGKHSARPLGCARDCRVRHPKSLRCGTQTEGYGTHLRNHLHGLRVNQVCRSHGSDGKLGPERRLLWTHLLLLYASARLKHRPNRS